MEKLEVKTDRGTLSAEEYDDGMANGLRISLDCEIIAMIDVYRKNGDETPEIRVIVYDDPAFDEPSHCITVQIQE